MRLPYVILGAVLMVGCAAIYASALLLDLFSVADASDWVCVIWMPFVAGIALFVLGFLLRSKAPEVEIPPALASPSAPQWCPVCGNAIEWRPGAPRPYCPSCRAWR